MSCHKAHSSILSILVIFTILIAITGESLASRDVPNHPAQPNEDMKHPEWFFGYDEGTVLIPGLGRVTLPPFLTGGHGLDGGYTSPSGDAGTGDISGAGNGGSGGAGTGASGGAGNGGSGGVGTGASDGAGDSGGAGGSGGGYLPGGDDTYVPNPGVEVPNPGGNGGGVPSRAAP